MSQRDTVRAGADSNTVKSGSVNEDPEIHTDWRENVLARTGATIEFLNKDAVGGRLQVGSIGGVINVSYVSLALVRDPVTHAVRCSMNPLFSLALLAAIPTHVSSWRNYLAVLALPHLLGNLGLQYPVIRNHLYLTAAERTDYYLFNSPLCVYIEGSLGLAIQWRPVRAAVRFTWPATLGYLENRKPYIGADLSWVW